MGFITPAQAEALRLKREAIDRERAVKELRSYVEGALGQAPEPNGKRRTAIRSDLHDFTDDVVSLIQGELAAAGWETDEEVRGGSVYLMIWPAPEASD